MEWFQVGVVCAGGCGGIVVMATAGSFKIDSGLIDWWKLTEIEAIWGDLRRFEAIWGDLRGNLGRLRGETGWKCLEILANSIENWREICGNRVEMDQNWTTLIEMWPNLTSNWLNFDKFIRNWSKCIENDWDLAKHWLNLIENWIKIRRDWSKFEVNDINSGQIDWNFFNYW